ncbi:MAG: hypothetical protein GY757_28725 [bacterium]|nr:hypothetical protein [bacterium]
MWWHADIEYVREIVAGSFDGTWGEGILQNDTALDIYTKYLMLYNIL